MVIVHKHQRRVKGKLKNVKTYNRKKRTRSKKRVVDEKIYLKSPGQKRERVRDGNGEFIGWKLTK